MLLSVTCAHLPDLGLVQYCNPATTCHGHGICQMVLQVSQTDACVSTDSGRCVHSRGWPSSVYHSNDKCTITVVGAGRVSAVGSFKTEEDVDKLHIDGRYYSGSQAPKNASVHAGSTITWKADSSEEKTGWKVCADRSSGQCICAHGLTSSKYCTLH